MTWSRLQSASGGAASTTTVTVTYTANVSSGTKLIAWVIADTGTGTPSITSVKDGGGNTFTQVASTTGSATAAGLLIACYSIDTPAGDVGTKPAITATFSAANTPADISMLIQEVSGLVTGNAADGTAATSTPAQAASVAQPAYTSSTANEYLVAFFGDDGDSQTFSAPVPPYTADAANINTSGVNDVGVIYKNSTGGAETGTWTFTGNTSGHIDAFIVVAFQVATASAAAPVLQIPPGGRIAPLTQAFGPAVPFAGAPSVSMPAVTVTSGGATMAALSSLSALVTQLAPATMAAQAALSALALQSGPVTMAASTGLANVPDLSAPVTLAVAAGLSALGDQAAVATLGAQAGLVNVAVLSAPATMAAASALTAPALLSAPATMAAGAVLTSLADQLVTVTMAAASTLTGGGGGTGSGSGTMGSGSSLAVLGDLSAPVTMALASQLLASGVTESAPVALAAAAGLAVVAVQRALVTLAAAAALSATGGAPPPAVQPGGGSATVGDAHEGKATVAGTDSPAKVTARGFIVSVGAGAGGAATVSGQDGKAKATKGFPH